jgi:hypothetical protein
MMFVPHKRRAYESPRSVTEMGLLSFRSCDYEKCILLGRYPGTYMGGTSRRCEYGRYFPHTS